MKNWFFFFIYSISSGNSREETKPDTPPDGDCETSVNKPSTKISEKEGDISKIINVNDDNNWHVNTRNHIIFETKCEGARKDAKEKNEHAISNADIWLKIMKIFNEIGEEKPTEGEGTIETEGGEKSGGR